MLYAWRAWRERDWQEIDAARYAAAWHQFGGSVATHPEVVARLSAFAGIEVRYLGYFAQGQLQAAIATWGAHLALSKDVLKKQKKRGLFDLGNAEIILPFAPQAQARLRHRGRYLSALNQSNVLDLREQPEGLALAREPEQYSKKFRYNQRREQRLLEESGGQIQPISSFTAEQQATMYADLFRKRWGFAAAGEAHLAEVFSLLHEFMVGSVIYLEDQPAAIQILYQVESPKWLSVEYINGGVDPQSREFSPGSVLSYINTQQAWSEARAKGKDLRYSFGRADREYKDRWCNRQPSYRV